MTRKQIVADLDRIVANIEKKHEDRKARTERQALADIQSVRIMLQSQRKRYKYELSVLEKMDRYVLCYRFLPASYCRMLDIWTAHYLANFAK